MTAADVAGAGHLDAVADEVTTPVVVLPGWRIHYHGVWGPGQVVALPLSVAVQWLAWGSVVSYKEDGP